MGSNGIDSNGVDGDQMATPSQSVVDVIQTFSTVWSVSATFAFFIFVSQAGWNDVIFLSCLVLSCLVSATFAFFIFVFSAGKSIQWQL